VTTPTRKPCRDPLLAAYRARREELGLTQTDLAELHGLQQRSVSDLELGRSAPTLVRLRTVAEALDCDLVLMPRSAPPNVSDEQAGVQLHISRVRRAEELAPVVARMTASGVSASVIAERLGVSVRTVERLRVANGQRAVQSDPETELAS
jgi:predicted transcriptional regulator